MIKIFSGHKIIVRTLVGFCQTLANVPSPTVNFSPEIPPFLLSSDPVSASLITMAAQFSCVHRNQIWTLHSISRLHTKGVKRGKLS